MCETCGCGLPESKATIIKPGEKTHVHPHDHEHRHDHDHERILQVEQDVLSKNNLLAETNRGYFHEKNIFVVNLVSSPGSGKTTLLERTIPELGKDISFTVIEGDQQTSRDAERVEAAGVPVVQINTGTGCHLDARMIQRAVEVLNPPEKSVLIIENVGNLVCPALFDLGEAHKVLIVSVTEGDDKPQKYPTMFNISDICIINKTDLLPYVDFDVERFKEYTQQINHRMEFLELSAKTGEGMKKWTDWLQSKVKQS